jgi:signal recognition particle receptor subunit beta
MVQFNFSEKTIKAKVVYYGPAQSGKTTNLEQIHRVTDPAGNNRLISLNTAQDRTLFFDLLPFSLGAISGYDFKVQLYTVPGQVQYNATRRVVLAGADAVVFVADSRRQVAKENVAAFENMKVNLLANRLVPEKVPLVLQFNKRDLADLQAPEELDRGLNFWHRPTFRAVAARGEGVMETFVAVVKEMLASIAAKYNLKEKGLDPAAIPELVEAAFANLLQQAQIGAPPAGTPERPPARIVLSQAHDSDQGAPLQAGGEAGLVSEEVLHRSIRTNVELAEVLAGLVRDLSAGLSNILSQAELLMVYREDAREKRQAAALAIQAEASRLRKVMRDLGDAGAPARDASGARPGAAAHARPPAPRPAGAATPAPAAAPTLDRALRDGIEQARDALAERQLSVDVQVPPVALPPRIPPDGVARAFGALLQGLAALSTPGATVRLRAERKPVLMRSRDGSEIKRDFVMLATAHEGVLTPEQQQRVLQGTDGSPIAAACRTVKELGGFVRFAPLSGGGLETRFFLPSA